MGWLGMELHWLWAVAGVVALMLLALGWYAATVARNRARRRALDFAEVMLSNAEAIREARVSGYQLNECLAVVDAYYKASCT